MPSEHVDVLIVGAGISGMGAGCRLQERCPDKTFAILEARGAIGGTWDLFRFPGIRSDSDMYTLCYPFRPWSGEQMIVDGGSILDYIRETAREYGIDRRIRFHHRVVAAEWSSDDARWIVEVARTDTGETLHLTCGSCSRAPATTATTRGTRRSSRVSSASAARSCIPSSGATKSTTPASGWS
jgi:cation diffusion facilitator CzcD-associated flavoprotein CzcO